MLTCLYNRKHCPLKSSGYKQNQGWYHLLLIGLLHTSISRGGACPTAKEKLWGEKASNWCKL